MNRVALAVALAFLAAIDAASVEPALGASFSVNSTNDAVDASPGDGVCQTSTVGECTLRAAIQEANASPGTHTVSVPTGTYLLTIPGSNEDAAATGDLDITGSVTIIGGGAETTIVDAQGLDRVFHVRPSAAATLSGITIRGGAVANDVGAGIFNEGTLDLMSSVVSDNNQTEIGGGGGIENAGTLTVSYSTVRNSSTWQAGAGIENEVGATATIANSLVSGNTNSLGGSSGAGVANWGQFTLTRSTVTGNGGVGFGGGIYNGEAPATMQISQSRVVANAAFFSGAGIAAKGSVTISDSEVSANSAGSSAGVLIAGDGADAIASFNVVNTTVSGNASAFDAGGIGFAYANGQLNNVTITQNTSDSDANGTGDGGGISVYASTGTQVTVRNSIIAGNIDSGGEIADCQGGVQSGGYNLIDDSTGCTVGGDPTGNLFNVAANLGPLASNGGPTMTHALLPGSPAIDAGSPAVPGSGGNACETSDQRGTSRPQGARCDMGAYEKLVGPAVGGIAQQPDPGALLPASSSSGSRAPDLIGAAIALAIAASSATAWHRHKVLKVAARAARAGLFDWARHSGKAP